MRVTLGVRSYRMRWALRVWGEETKKQQQLTSRVGAASLLRVALCADIVVGIITVPSQALHAECYGDVLIL